ncbi:MAG: ABC transporter ATP-binding protein [Corynebacteriales bacterium]|nr:ABC transporter ATP-binding protein [Mycobacteriales bacterium]
MRLMGRAIADEPRIFSLAVAGSVLFSLVTVGTAYAFGAITEHVVQPALKRDEVDVAALVSAGLVVLAISILKIIGILGRRLAGGVMAFRQFARYRRRVANKLVRLPAQGRPTGDLLSVANSDVEAAWFIIMPLPFAVGTVAMVVVAIVALFVTDWALALFGLALFPLIFFMNMLYSSVLTPRTRTAQKLRGEVSAVAHESFDGALIVKALGRGEHESVRFETKVNQLRDAQVSVGRIRGLFNPAMDALPALATVAALFVGVVRLQSGAVTIADLVTVAYLLTAVAFPLRSFGWVLGELPRSIAGWERIRGVLDASEGPAPGTTPLANNGQPIRVDVKDLVLSYDGQQPVLRDVNVAIPAGKTIALVGATGSGKTTLVQSLINLLKPQRGEIQLDNVPLGDIEPASLSERVAWVGQSTFLFDDTVAQNITLYGSFSEDEIWRALELAHAAEFVQALPDGLNTRLGERGVSLSGGQRQRLALARALVRRPALLLLDDATSAVDPKVERAILKGLRSGVSETTVVLVAYRRASISLADEVAYLEEGRILAQGSHDELLATVPGYAAVVTAYETNMAEAPS